MQPEENEQIKKSQHEEKNATKKRKNYMQEH